MSYLKPLHNWPSDVSINEVARIQFFQETQNYDEETGFITKSRIWINAVKCAQKYAKQIAANPDSDLANELKHLEWICPETDEIQLLRDPEVVPDLNGINF